MPRCVRNFWIELEVDGKKEKVATGPKNGGGGFHLKVRLREKGFVSSKVVDLVGRIVEAQDKQFLVILELVDTKGKYHQLYKEIRDGKKVKRDRSGYKKRVEKAVLRSRPLLRSVSFDGESGG